MNKTKINLAIKTLKLLEKSSWKNIQLNDVLGNEKNNNLKSKKDLLININKYFDYMLKKNLTSLEDSSSKDIIIEVFMARFDILNIHRSAIQKLIKNFKSKPYEMIPLMPSFIESIILISTLAGLKIDGIKGIANIKALLILYFITIFIWENDKTSYLEKTMTALDKNLSMINKFIKIYNV